MSKFSKIRIELAKMLAKFSDLKTSNGVLTWDSDEDLKAGMDVYVMDENGEYAPAADGDYVTEDGKTIVVKEGRVESITDPKAEVDPEEGMSTVEVAAEEEVADPTVQTDGVKESETDAIDAIHREINELYDIVDKLTKKVAELEAKGTETKETVEKMSKMSAAFSAEEEIETKRTTPTSGNAEIDRKLKNFIG